MQDTAAADAIDHHNQMQGCIVQRIVIRKQIVA